VYVSLLTMKVTAMQPGYYSDSDSSRPSVLVRQWVQETS